MTLVLWDIDGTLVTTAGAGRRAIDRAFEEVFGWREATTGIKFDGRTDLWIVDVVGAARGRPPEERDQDRRRVLDAYVRHLDGELRNPPPGRPFGPLPGVVAALAGLRVRGCVSALLTGNIEAGARAKLSAFDLWRAFPFGAWGDDAEERPALLPVALERARAVLGRHYTPGETVVIGDTPRDVEVGKVHGARTVAVATGGGYGRAELAACEPDVVVETLEDVGALIEFVVRSS